MAGFVCLSLLFLLTAVLLILAPFSCLSWMSQLYWTVMLAVTLVVGTSLALFGLRLFREERRWRRRLRMCFLLALVGALAGCLVGLILGYIAYCWDYHAVSIGQAIQTCEASGNEECDAELLEGFMISAIFCSGAGLLIGLIGSLFVPLPILPAPQRERDNL